MLREVALRRALQHARDVRGRELEDVVERSRALRRRLRELTDRQLALGTVHTRFFPEAPASAEPTGEPAVVAPTSVSAPSPVPEAMPTPPPRPEPVVIRAAPSPHKEDETVTKLLPALRARYPDGFTVGQMREVLDEIEPRAHTYDSAWTLANNLARSRVFEIAGTKPGPAGPIRVFRVPRPASPEMEAT